MEASSSLAAEVMRTCLSAHEQNLLRMAGAGKSLEGIAAIYRQYGGPNGVQEKLDEIRAKVQERLADRVERGSGERPLEEHVAAAQDDDGRRWRRPAGSIPLMRVRGAGLTGRLDGAGAVPAKSQSTPPSRPASASPRPVFPSAKGLDEPAASPAPARGRPQGDASVARDARVLELLREEPRSAAGIGVIVGESRSLIRKSLERLRARGAVEPMNEAAFDYPRSPAGGPPATAWRVVGDTRPVRLPAPQQHPTSDAAREAVRVRERAVVEWLTREACSQRRLADELGETPAKVRSTLEALERDGRAFRTGHSAHDWKMAIEGRGRPSTVWAVPGALSMCSRPWSSARRGVRLRGRFPSWISRAP